MPPSAPPRNRFPPNSRSKPVTATKKKVTAAATEPGTRPKKARAHREGDEDIVREARSDDDLQSDADDDDDDDDDSSFTSSIASVPERPLTRKASNGQGNGKTQPPSSVAGSSTLPIMQFPDEDVNGRALLSSLHDAHHAWSDMVAHADGDDLPVLDFADMRAPSPAAEDEPESVHMNGARSEPKRGTSSAVHRPIGVSARQAYLQRLEADPSYTPRVGEFWSHDERLLDKDLRSLSGWWRGRWRGRGRGEFGTGWGGRRPGGRFSGREQWGVASESNDPTDQDWRHDGYEEIERAKEAKVPRQSAEQSLGRGGFWSTRGRGRNGAARDGFDSLKPSNETSSSHERTPPIPARPSPTPRLWYRPEYAWTRHAATYLFSDGSPKPRFGGGGRLRVKLPGQTRYTFARLPPVGTNSEPAPSTPSQPTRQFVVRLPKAKLPKEGEGEEGPEPHLNPPAPLPLQPEDAHTVALPPLPDELNVAAPVTASAPTPVPVPAPVPAPAAHEPAVQGVTPKDDPPASTSPVQTSTLLLSEPALAQQGQEVAMPPPPPPPVNQPMVHMAPTPSAPSPSYPSPSYQPGPFPYPLHHPVATYPTPVQEPMWYDPRMPYGYPTPPPVPQNMYTPPPPPSAMHHHHHSHSHSHSISLPPMLHPPHAPGFYGMPPPPIPRPTPIEQLPSISYGPNGAMVDTATGTPIFSLAKPRVRVNIRKPSESPSPSNAPNESVSSEGSSRALTSESTQSFAPTEEQERSKTLEQRATEPAPTFSANNPYAPQAGQQQQWDPYGNPMGGFYYPPPPPMHPQQYPSPAEFGYPSGVSQAPSGYPPYLDSASQGPAPEFQHPPQHPPIFY